MRRKVVNSLLGASLIASLLVVTQGGAGAQAGWNGFSAVAAPSILEVVNNNNPVPAWGAAVTEDLGGPGVDIWTNNHAFRAEAMIDFAGTTFGGSYLAPPNVDTHGIVFTDLDGDGDEDVLEIMARDNDARVLRNDGGALLPVTTPLGIEDNLGRGRQPIVLDYNGDGAMDIIVPNLDRVPIDGQAAPSELYLSNGNGTFAWTKVADPGQLLDDGDLNFVHQTRLTPGGDNIVFTSNNFTIALDSLAPGSNALVAAATPIIPTQGAVNNATHIRDLALADLDGDLDPEFVIARQDNNLETDTELDDQDPPQPTGDGVPDLVGLLPISIGDLATAGNPTPTTAVSTDPLADNCRAITLADFDNDADVDIFGGCSFDDAAQNQNIILLNDGLGNFTLSALPVTTDDTAVSTVAADLNNDGWMDVFAATGYDTEFGDDFVFLNQGGTGNYFQIDLVGDNPDVAGAQVFVGTDKWQTRQTSHVGHQGQDTRTLHFGLAAQTAIASVQVVWPDNSIESCWTGGTVNSRITITKGQPGCVPQTLAELQTTLAAAPDVTPPPAVGPFCQGVQVTVQIGLGQSPTAGNDVILGTSGADIIDGLAGSDIICGLGGNDVIDGGAGIDFLYGDDGDDTLNGGDGNDRMWGDVGNDIMNGDDGNDRMIGGDGLDTMNGGNDRDVIQGGKGDDVIDGGANIDRLSGNGGADTIRGANGKDQVRGHGGNDSMWGGGGPDFIDGGPGTDQANGGASADLCIAETATKCEQ